MSAPEWMAGMKGRAGPLLEPALRAVERSPHPATFPAGQPGLQIVRDALYEQVAHEAATPEEDRRWVEEYGALFGLLLLEVLDGVGHVQRAGVHRVAIGRFGAFDPFGGLESALEHEEPGAEYVRQVALAEAESAGRGPVSRVVVAFERALAQRRTDLSITGQFELQLSLGTAVEVDLRQAAESTAHAPASALISACEKLVSMLPGGDDAGGRVSWGDAEGRIMPRVVGEAFLGKLGEEHRGAIYQMALAKGLYLALLLDYAGRSRFLRSDEVKGWSLEEEEIIKRAVNNLAARSGSARFTKERHAEATIVVGQSRDGWDASRLVLPGLYEVLAEQLQPPFVVSAPHRDELLACSGGDPVSIAALRKRASDNAARAPHAVSPEVFHLSPEGLKALPLQT